MFKLLKRQKPQLPAESSTSSSDDVVSSVYLLGASSPLRQVQSMNFTPHKTVDFSIDEVQNDSFDPFEVPEARRVKSLCSLSAIVLPPSKDERLVHFLVPNPKKLDSLQVSSSSSYSEPSSNHGRTLNCNSIDEYREQENIAQSKISEKLAESDSIFQELATTTNEDVLPVTTKIPTDDQKVLEKTSNVENIETVFAPASKVQSFDGGTILSVTNFPTSSSSEDDASNKGPEKLDELRKSIVNNLSIETNYFVPLSKDPLVFLTRLDRISIEIKEMVAKKDLRIADLMDRIATLESNAEITTATEQIRLLKEAVKETASAPVREFNSVLESHRGVAATLKAMCQELGTFMKIDEGQQTELMNLPIKLEEVLEKVKFVSELVEITSTCVADNNNHIKTVENAANSLHTTYKAMESQLNQLKLNSIRYTTDTKQLASQIQEYVTKKPVSLEISGDSPKESETKRKLKAYSELAQQLQINQNNLQATYQNNKRLYEENCLLKSNLENEMARSKSLEKIVDRKEYKKTVQSRNQAIQAAHNEELEMAEYIRKITHNNQILHDSNVLSKYCLDQLIEGVFSYLLTYYDKESNDRIKELTINIQKKPYISVEDMKIVSELVHTFQRGVTLLAEAYAESEIQLETEYKRRIAGQDATLCKLAHLMELRLNEALIQ